MDLPFCIFSCTLCCVESVPLGASLLVPHRSCSPPAAIVMQAANRHFNMLRILQRASAERDQGGRAAMYLWAWTSQHSNIERSFWQYFWYFTVFHFAHSKVSRWVLYGFKRVEKHSIEIMGLTHLNQFSQHLLAKACQPLTSAVVQNS